MGVSVRRDGTPPPRVDETDVLQGPVVPTLTVVFRSTVGLHLGAVGLYGSVPGLPVVPTVFEDLVPGEPPRPDDTARDPPWEERQVSLRRRPSEVKEHSTAGGIRILYFQGPAPT